MHSEWVDNNTLAIGKLKYMDPQKGCHWEVPT